MRCWAHGRLTLELTTSKETFWGMALGTERKEKQKEMGNIVISIEGRVGYIEYFSCWKEKSAAFTASL